MEFIEWFNCRDEQGGVHRVGKWQAQIVVPMLAGRSVIPGVSEYKLSTGEFINATDDPTVFLTKDGRILRRMD